LVNEASYPYVVNWFQGNNEGSGYYLRYKYEI
jgi:hypothetical protein